MCAIMGFTSPTLKEETMRPFFDRTLSRGPDQTRVEPAGKGWLCFHRLAIMGLSEEGMQPFHLGGDMVVCNGEIYGFRKLRAQRAAKYTFRSESDCEILLPLYREYGLEMFKMLDAEFAMILYDAQKDSLIAARDPIGIRPLFYGYLEDGGIVFASEAKNLVGLCARIEPFPPGHYYCDGKFVRYADLTTVTQYAADDLDTVCRTIREKLIAGVEKRLDADAPLGFLLSGGLDSSLVCAISAKLLGKKIRTFAIGMDLDPIDLKYAREVADYIGAEHTEVTMTRGQVLDTLEEVISLLGTYDITTIRASMGMYLCCKAIHEQTDVRVLLTGEISDELFGYKYTDFAPSPEAFQQEAKKRVDELYMYDVLRADRCISANSIEARVPFGDLARRSGIGRSRFRPQPRHDGCNATADRRRGNQNQQCLHTKANVRNRMRSGKRSPPKKLKIGIIRIIRHEETRNRLHTAALPRRAGRGLRVRRPLFRPAAQTLPLGVIKPALASALDFSYL